MYEFCMLGVPGSPRGLEVAVHAAEEHEHAVEAQDLVPVARAPGRRRELLPRGAVRARPDLPPQQALPRPDQGTPGPGRSSEVLCVLCRAMM